MTELKFPNVPQVYGRVLIGGTIQNDGFSRRKVYSTCTDNPAGHLLGETADVDVGKVMEAVDAASLAWSNGLGDWPTSRMEQRISAVVNFRGKMMAQREIISRFLMWEIGKSWVDAQAEFDRTIQYIDDTIEEVKTLDRDSSRFQFAGEIVAQIRRAPLGVTLCMGPFNYP